MFFVFAFSLSGSALSITVGRRGSTKMKEEEEDNFSWLRKSLILNLQMLKADSVA